MRLIGKKLLHDFCKRHPDCKSWVANWVADAKAAKWASLNELKARYPSASILPDNTVIFNVRGNNYRLAVQVALKMQMLAVKWIGTHAEYSRKKF